MRNYTLEEKIEVTQKHCDEGWSLRQAMEACGIPMTCRGNVQKWCAQYRRFGQVGLIEKSRGRPTKEEYAKRCETAIIAQAVKRMELEGKLSLGRDARPADKFAAISRLKSTYSLKKLCEFFGVSRSGYYKWENGDKINFKDKLMCEIIESIQQDSMNTYGYRRMTIALNKQQGIVVNHKTVYRIMRQYNLLSGVRRKQEEVVYHYENILGRNFCASAPNQKWVTDVTCVMTDEGRIFLSIIKDIYDGYIVGYVCLDAANSDLVIRTIQQAVEREKRVNGVMLHSDQGFQYTSEVYRQLLKRNGMIPSMSRRGTPTDNAPAESFFACLKTECLGRERIYTTAQAKALIDRYIDFYNNERIQTKFQATPAEIRRKYYYAEGVGSMFEKQ